MKIFDDLKHNKKKALERKEYLKKGKYVLLPNMRTYVHKEKYKEALKRFPQGVRNWKKALFHMLLRPFFSFKVKNNSNFEGQAIYFSTVPNPKYRDCKIFSYKQKKVVIFCANKKRYDLYVKNREKNDMFPQPILYEADEKGLCIYEEFLCDKQEDKNISKELLLNLFSFYSRYYEQCHKSNRIVNSNEKESLLCADVTSKECPVLYLHHADLSIDNLIYYKKTEERIVFIDFDHENYYPPFYDIFFLMFNQLISGKDGTMLEYFKKGMYDEYLYQYSDLHNISLKDLLVAPIKFLWHRRMQDYSSEKKSYIKNIFSNFVSDTMRRIEYGKGK